MYSQPKKFQIFRSIEKVGYAVGLGGVFFFCGYKLYEKNVLEVEKRALELKKLEDHFYEIAKSNMAATSSNSEQINLIKLQSFKKKVYAIGVYDDPLSHMIETKGIEGINAQLMDKDLIKDKANYLQKLSLNIKLIRDLMRDLRPEALVVEMCDDRHTRWLQEVIAHPNYDNTVIQVHQILDKKPSKLAEFDQIELEDSNMEYLIGIDYCSYRMPCKTILGDRSYLLTKKRYESKIQMLDVYKEAVKIGKTKDKTAKQTIFDVSNENNKIGLENSVEQLKQAIKKVQTEKGSSLPKQLDEMAVKESLRTQADIYNDVVIDEINNQLLKSVQKAEGEIIVLLMRAERLSSFSDLWKKTNMDFYQTQENKILSERLRQK